MKKIKKNSIFCTYIRVLISLFRCCHFRYSWISKRK